MAWRDGVVQGSFRGVPFQWDETGGDHGRRLVKHEFPNRDTAEGEDLGRKSRSFTLDVFILKPSFPAYQAARDALIAACEQPGTGQLVHPTKGTMTVFCEGCRWRESTDQMGKCDFSLTFWDPGSVTFTAGAIAPDRAAAVDSAALTLQLDLAASFLAAFATLGFIAAVMLPLLAQIAALAAIFDLVAAMVGLALSIANAAGIISGQAATVAAWFAALTQLEEADEIILAQPAALLALIEALIAGLPYLPPSNTPVPIATWSDIRQTGPVGAGLPPATLFTPPPVDGFSQAQIDTIRVALTVLASLGLDVEIQLDGSDLAPMTAALLSQITLQPAPGASSSVQAAVAPVYVPGVTPVAARQIAATTTPASRAEASPIAGVTPSRVQMAINQVSLIDLVRRLALAQLAQAVASSIYPTVAAAEAARDDVASRLDLEMQLTQDDAVYQDMAALRVAVIQQVNATIATLPAISTITLPAAIPALVLAHRLYDDPSWDTDIIARNDVVHPGFVPGGVPLQVLSNGQ
jgi:prophage DNA circulation protein